jgi:2-keto-3-deoxy-6-phosphogluconate aldolase
MSVQILTPYGAAKIVNAELKANGIEKVLPPQMFYNYTTARLNKGKSPMIKFTFEGGIDREDLARWTKAYIAKQGGATVADPEQAAFDEAEAN